jgi:hypothetical protein
MCGGGGGGAAEAAETRETERLAEIKRATSAIDAAFGGRGAQQQDFVGALRSFLSGDVRKQQKIASRGLKFGLARSGLTGGSTAVDVGRTLGEEFSTGLLKAERGAQAGLSNLKASDEAARIQLLGLAQSGLSSQTASQRAAEAIRSNLATAKAGVTTSGVADVFGKTSDLFRKQEEAAERRRGLSEAEVFASPFSR